MTGTHLTVRDLVNSESLETVVLAGEGGLDRFVSWAHSCEMKNPWRWLGPNELLMTVGLCIPETADAQRNFIAQLDEAGLAGMVSGPIIDTPEISDEMIAEANARDFPLLLASAQTPFAALGRTVAAATATEQAQQVLKLSKMYHLATFAESDPHDLLTRLESLLEIGIRVLDVETEQTVAEGTLAAQMSSSHTVGVRVRTYPLPSDASVQLELREPKGKELDSFLQVHLLKIVEVGVGRVLGLLGVRIEESEQALAQLLNGKLPSELDRVMPGVKLSDGFALVSSSLANWPRVSRAVAIAQLPVLVARSRGSVLALVPSQWLNDVRELLENLEVQAGVSGVFTDYRDVAFAAEQAEQTRLSAGAQESWSVFEGVNVSLLTRSRDEAAELVEQVLGDLTHIDPKMVTLRETLFAFLRNDRHWQQTAAELSIHRQTLSYRLNRIRELTGRDLAGSADLSALWLAYQAWLMLESDG